MLEPITIITLVLAAIIVGTISIPTIARMPAVQARKGEDGAITFEYVLIVAGIGALAIAILTFLFGFLTGETSDIVDDFSSVNWEDHDNTLD